MSRARLLARVGFLCLFALLAAEVLSRADDWVRLGTPFAHTPNYEHDLRLVDWFGIRGRPNGQYLQWKLNEFGFRGPPMTREKQPGCTRVMVLGASESFGLYESLNHEYPAQLRDSLRSHGCYEVVNSAIVGAGLQGQIRLWEHYSSQFRPDIVILLPAPGVYLSSMEPDWLPVSGKATSETAVPFRPRVFERFRRVWTTPELLQRYRIKRWIAADTAGKPPDWFFRDIPESRLRAFMRDLDSLVASVNSRGAELILVTHPVAYSGPSHPNDEFVLLGARQFFPRAMPDVIKGFERAAADRMRVYSEQRHVRLVDAFAAFMGRRDLFVDGVHFTDQGAAAMASLLAREILHNRGQSQSSEKPLN